jgi:hypothetical protein
MVGYSNKVSSRYRYLVLLVCAHVAGNRWQPWGNGWYQRQHSMGVGSFVWRLVAVVQWRHLATGLVWRRLATRLIEWNPTAMTAVDHPIQDPGVWRRRLHRADGGSNVQVIFNWSPSMAWLTVSGFHFQSMGFLTI